MRRTVLVWLCIVALSGTIAGHDTQSDGSVSLRFSCLNSGFLSVSAHTPQHDGFPDVDLRLVDPLGRTAGAGRNERPIPSSQYGKIFEIRQQPQKSRAVAVEICDAIPGRYVITILEHSDAEYRVTVRGEGARKTGMEGLILYPAAEGNRTCRYKFDFVPKQKEVARWLDDRDRPLRPWEQPACSPIPRV